MEQQLILDDALIAKYDQSGPRYTSYPTAVQFREGFTAQDYADIARQTNTSGRPLSLYFHIPFCDTICFYCACNKVATKDRSKGNEYLQRLHREIALQGELFDSNRPVEQLHWGGGTPTFISHEEMRQLMKVTGEHFHLLDNDEGEYSIEIDPREATAETVAVLRDIGFNRMSLGVQDFDPRVQRAVNRIQSEEETLAVLNAARAEGFRSVSIDLIYGLPHQTKDSFSATLDRIIEVGPDRLSVFNYAHLPQIFKPQRRIEVNELPPPEVKLEILHMTASKLADAGYVYIGMDHFARPDDELAVAQREGTLYRNFQGYSTHANCDLIGMGITSIGSVGNCYAQNLKGLDDYYECIDAGRLPVFRGIELSKDDELRRDVITQLICHFALDFSAVEKRWNIDFKAYFDTELNSLQNMVGDGLLEISEAGIKVMPVGQMLIRNICMVFDAYLKDSKGQRFSKVI
ncbi:oxygen-independent coproporphyrinogen III oxidase [Thiolapillus sp.]